MKTRALLFAFRAFCWGVFVLAVVWPTIALIVRCGVQAEAPDGGFRYSVRQFGLLWRSLWLSGTATVFSLLVSIPAAYCIGRVRRLADRPLMAGAIMLLLLTPPMVCAFGWERLLPASFDGHIRCIALWALWTWPIPALILGIGWSRSANEVYEAALLVTSRSNAFLRVALPQLRRHAAVAALIVFLLCFRDYAVPHACGLLVFSTELLGWARDSTRTIDTVWPSLPAVALTIGLVFAALRLGRFTTEHAATGTMATVDSVKPGGRRRDLLVLLAIGCFVVSWLVPVGTLVVSMASLQAWTEAVRTYGPDLAWSVALAGGCGLIVVSVGLGLMVQRRCRRVVMVWSLAFGALPGALVGESLVSAYNHWSLWWVYDYWPVIALCYIARFLWIGLAVGFLIIRSTPPLLTEQAAIDGAGLGDRIARILVPLSLPTLFGGAAVVMALSLAEVPASSIVRIPSISLIAHVLMEKFHRFEYGMLVALSLWLAASAVLAAGLSALAVRRRAG